MEEGTSYGWLMINLVAIWMVMTPLPVAILLAAVDAVELTIRSMPFAEVQAIGMVFAVIPLMVVTAITIVIARMIDPDNHFLGSARLGCRRNSERRSQK